MFLRTNFSSSPLVRLLGDAAAVDASAPRQDVAERLSQWVGIFDAATLHAVHQSIAALDDDTPASGLPASALPLEEQVRQVRAVLAKAIATPAGPVDFGQRARHPLNQPEPAPDTEVDFAVYRKRYLDLQRNMELMVEPLRDHLRQTLSKASPQLRQLAALDAAWEKMLEAREQNLLMTVPGFLEKRFKQLRQAHGQDEPALWRQPGGWVHVFEKEMQEVLLAELNHRLEPVVGLTEAFNSKTKDKRSA
ncbi:MAG: hypothetical protein JWP29_4812 [Rhodoferax sp.]|nr:hypothetical protein [Rhodoferax sp.]